tara:strand:- start:2505 stop:3146 length:642 start_codon:yes stop_codon:yes gene_type:complete
MDQDIEIINTNTRNEKIKNFFVNNKNKLIVILTVIILCLFAYFFYQDYKLDKKENLANKYNVAVTKYNSDQKDNIENILKEIINSKDKTYSPLAFYFLMDKGLIQKDEINKFFDIIINEINLDKEIKNLTIYKKALYNSDFAKENELLEILNPVIKSESVWKLHALYLMAEYYLSKNQKQKSKEFFEQIISLDKVNSKIKIEAQKRLRAEFSE